ncbi:MAG TPA: S49 family peptidase, partial [Pirellulaceae bacterium]
VIQETKKPVVASMGDVAASGGYYISMGCDKIFAEPGTLTGSIGVVGGKLVLGPMFEKFGMTTDVISLGKNSGLFSTNRKFSESERKAWQGMMDEIYRQFTRKAAKGRDMDVEDLLKLAGGRIWTGRQAEQNGLVDELGTLRDAVREAQDLAGLDTSEEPELLILPEAKSIFEQIFEGNSAQARAISDQIPSARLMNELRLMERLFAEPGITLMPYTLEIK